MLRSRYTKYEKAYTLSGLIFARINFRVDYFSRWLIFANGIFKYFAWTNFGECHILKFFAWINFREYENHYKNIFFINIFETLPQVPVTNQSKRNKLMEHASTQIEGGGGKICIMKHGAARIYLTGKNLILGQKWRHFGQVTKIFVR